MKKFVLGILLVCLACSLVACSSPADNQADSPVEQSVENVTVDLDNETADKAIENIPQEFDYAKTNVFADCAEITYVRVNSGAEISPPKPESIYHTYSATSGNVFIDFIADVKNLKDTSLAVKDLVTLVLIMGEDAHRANAIVEEDGGIDFDAYYTVAPLETVRVHFLVEVPESQKNEEMKLNVFSDTSDLLEAAFLYEEIVPEKQYISAGKTLKEADISEVTINSIDFSDIIEPRNPPRYYHYWEAESGKTFIIVDLDVKNLKGTDLNYESVLNIKAIYKDKYNYTGFVIYESDDGDLENYTSINSIAPLDTVKMYYLIDVPDEVTTGTVELELFYEGDVYYIKVN